MLTEQDPLIPQPRVSPDRHEGNEDGQQDGKSSIRHTPLVALFAAFGMNAAAASSVFVFARILCKNPSSCDSNEQNAFSGALANATIIANVCAILVIQPLNAISKERPKTVLLLWLIFRSSAIGLLWLAAQSKSIGMVLLSKVLEGTATDNILQFALSILYARAKDTEQFSTLMSESMAFSLLGSALGPIAAGLSRDFSTRIWISIGALLVATLYVVFVISVTHDTTQDASHSSRDDFRPNTEARSPKPTICSSLWRVIFSHLSIILEEPIFLAPSLSLMIYTMGQAYILPALMVYTSGRYGFTDRQNSWLLSLVTAVSASSTFFVRFVQRKSRGDIAHIRLNVIVAITGMSALAISLPFMMYTKTSWQLYPIIVSMSLGFSTSSFIKTYALCQLQNPKDGTAALAIFETVGSFLSPLTLGSAQTHWPEGKWTLLSTGIMAASIIILCTAQARRAYRQNSDSQLRS